MDTFRPDPSTVPPTWGGQLVGSGKAIDTVPLLWNVGSTCCVETTFQRKGGARNNVSEGTGVEVGGRDTT